MTPSMKDRMCCRCTRCGEMYFFCDHLGTAAIPALPEEEARFEAAKVLLRFRFAPDDDGPVPLRRSQIEKLIFECFGIDQDTPGAFDAPELPRR